MQKTTRQNTTTPLDPSVLAENYVKTIRAEIQHLGARPQVVGLIASHDKPSLAYANATQRKFAAIGISYEVRHVERLDLEKQILTLNADPTVHGIFIYFPVFNNEQDGYLRNLVDYRKDIEAGSQYWTHKLYANDRLALAHDPRRKALLPCTPLAIIKMLSEVAGYADHQTRPFSGQTVTIFNRSEVIGRPLAVMLSNDGALVYSFDVNGPLQFRDARPAEVDISREAALAVSNIVITGVPSEHFDKVQCHEIRPATVCLNFASVPNFADDIASCAATYIPKVGPMTVAMCMRNTVRLFNNFHRT